jgi:RHH-type proline utilization regulon transcriptional repressor/proline dehydrogenase/delta 1-pyrroline-5-carboxylate dehydrogenase
MEMVSSPSNQKVNMGPKGKRAAIATQAEILAKGQSIFDDMQADTKSIFNKDWWYGQIMDWSMKNEKFKTQMFRFVDVLPYLNSGSEVARHLKEYFAENGEKLPPVFSFGLGMGSLAPGLLAGAVKKNVTQMAKMFITGETPQEALPVLKKSRESGLTFTVDLLGEATLSESEAQDYSNRYMQLIEWLAKDAQSWEPHSVLDHDENGLIPKVNVSVKVTSLYSQVHESAWDETIAVLKERLRPIFRAALSNQVFINIDMEQYAHKDLTLDLFQQILMEDEFKNYSHFGIVIQAYLRDSESDIQKLVAFAQKRGVPFTIRLVKGAYWDFEVIKAKQRGWAIPVFTNKAESDVSFEKCAKLLIENYPSIRLAIGSHNVRSIAACLVMAENAGLPKLAIEVQMLYGMADQIKRSFVKQGYRVREYATVGELIPGMAYLVRRLLENTSNESWLKNKFADNVSTELLLADPMLRMQKSESAPRKKPGVFYNEPPVDFAIEKCRHEMLRSLAQTKKQFPVNVPAIIDGREIKAKSSFDRVNPSHPAQVLAQVSLTSTEDCEKAIQAAKKSFKTWSQTPAEERASILDKIADLIAEQRFELSAIEVQEVGKTWGEADGDISEAIDFCRYYAKEMRRLGIPFRTGHAPGELSLYQYQGKGVAAVIAPWNFPLAILTGMVASCVVTGNTVVMKPAEQSSLVALRLMQIFKKAGLPDGVVNFVPGRGEVVGEYLTGHKDIDIISFTGSQQVGLHIVQKAAQTQVGQKAVKRCVIEMGGKNAIIVDSDADLDEAVTGVLYSAFGFQGQKCSACSRVVVLEGIYDRFIERLVEATRSIHVGFSEDPRSFMGPVVDLETATKIKGTIEKAKAQFKLSYMGTAPAEGYFVPPTIFQDVTPNSELAQEEIFGPVLAILKAKDIDHALEIANGTQYALTGGLYSRSPAHIQKVKVQFEVGNLYINRGNTGAIVERHPFGGFKMSGVGSKTGGPDYLIQFMDPRVVTENTMRRGFAPPEESDI